MLSLTEHLLVCGGDARLLLDARSERNRYGCSVHPEPALAAFGSCTATSISRSALAASQQLQQSLATRLSKPTAARLYREQLERIRVELHGLCGLGADSGVETIFAASGTDLHLIASQLAASREGPPLHVIMMDGNETGSGVASALAGRHFCKRSALGGKVRAHEALDGAHPIELSPIALRHSDGAKRALTEIDGEIEALLQQSTQDQQRVLLVAIDASKTGLIAPSPAYLATLRQRHARNIDVLVDACQFRLGNASLKAYLDLGFMVGVTGSKFFTGPVFSGALLIPEALVPRLSKQTIPPALSQYCARAEWPHRWRAAESLAEQANFGLLLRWQAALVELRAFRALPEAQISHFMQQFADSMHEMLRESPSFASLAESRLDRSPLGAAPTWDQIPSIFPFLLYRAGRDGQRQPLTRAQTLGIYHQLQGLSALPAPRPAGPASAGLRCQFGQPVACGSQGGSPVSALRLCLSSRLIVQACSEGAASAQQVIAQARSAMDQVRSLLDQIEV